MTYPTPSGSAPSPIGEAGQTTRAQAVALYSEFLSGNFSPKLAVEWETFAAKFPKQTAYNTLHAFAVKMGGQVLGMSIAEFMREAGKVTAAAGKGGATGIKIPVISSPLQFLSELSNANLWMRVGQVALGLLLLAIGVAQLTDAVPIATTIAKAVK